MLHEMAKLHKILQNIAKLISFCNQEFVFLFKNMFTFIHLYLIFIYYIHYL